MLGDHPLTLMVSAEEAGMRVDAFVRQRLGGLSRGSTLRLIARRHVLVDGRPAAKGQRLTPGQRVLVAAAATSERPVPQPELPLEIVALRPELVVINKQPGVACHPLVPGETDTVANALVARHPECAEASPAQREAGLVHRLDWCTSGLLLAARDRRTYGRLRGAFSGGRVVKHYVALVLGQLERQERIVTGIRAMPGDRTRVQVVPTHQAEGRVADSQVFPLARLAGCTLVQVVCRTGLRHQVRAHLAQIGHPLVGDIPYGGSAHPELPGAFLHAARLELADGPLRFEANLPRLQLNLLAQLGLRSVVLPERSVAPLPR